MSQFSWKSVFVYHKEISEAPAQNELHEVELRRFLFLRIQIHFNRSLLVNKSPRMPWVAEVRQVVPAFQESVQSNSTDETRRPITTLQTRNSASVRDVPRFLWCSTR